MSRLSKEKEEKIMSNIIAILYQHSPQALFISEISKLEARDEEFTKRLLHQLKKKGFVVEVKKNPRGVEYLKRSRWRLSDSVYAAYRQHQGSKFL